MVSSMLFQGYPLDFCYLQEPLLDEPGCALATRAVFLEEPLLSPPFLAGKIASPRLDSYKQNWLITTNMPKG
jgi:hypothetical protein